MGAIARPDRSLGSIGQTWQNVLGSRAAATSYQNTSGKPIEVFVGSVDGGGGASVVLGVSVDNVTFVTAASQSEPAGGVNRVGVSAVVPPNHYYKATVTGSLDTWGELR